MTLGKQKNYFLGSLFRSKAIWVMGIVWIFSAGANIGLYFVIPLFLVKELSLDMDYANTIFGLSRLGGAVLTIVAGFFVDRFSLKRACFVLVLGHGHLHRAIGTEQCAMDTNFPVLAGLYFADCLPGGIRGCSKVVQSGAERPGHRVCPYYRYDRDGPGALFLGSLR